MKPLRDKEATMPSHRSVTNRKAGSARLLLRHIDGLSETERRMQSENPQHSGHLSVPSGDASTEVSAGSNPPYPGTRLSFEESLLQGASRLAAIARGEPFQSEIHPQVLAEPALLEIDRFSLWYGQKRALCDISMNIPRGKVTAIIGPSGCGKSTLIRCINRMNDLIDGVRVEGDIRLDGVSVFDPAVDVTLVRKRAGMVFQKPNPFPMSIFENVVYPLRIQGIRNRQYLQEQCERCLRAAALWDEVKDHLHQNALQLSGGQQQRLCIARALAGNPEVLLLDEPCSALDPIATNKIEELIHELAGQYTVVIVTHNMQQASRVSDYTALLYLGHLIEYGPTSEIFSAPRLPETEAYVTGRFG